MSVQDVGTAGTLREWLARGPYSLAMSSGFFGFFAHAGVLSVLEDEGLLPVRASGSSAGALVTALWASGLTTAELRDELFRLERRDFWDPAPGAGLLRGALFRSRLEQLVGGKAFADCRVPVSVSVFDLGSRRTRVLASGPLAPAVQASCTVPGLFHPVRHQGRVLFDGGILDRPGLAGLGVGDPRVASASGEQRIFYHHLTSRSPWRRRGSPALQVPSVPGMVSLLVGDLPRSGPFKLDAGRRAFGVAREAARRALDSRVTAGRVVV